jgi:predicted RNA-binding protein YlqC (UPF0109 family)
MTTGNGTGERIRDLLHGVVAELVDKPDEVAVDSVIGSGGRTVVLTITTAKGDIGKVIGKRGKTAEALRYLLEAMAARHKIKLVLEIDDGRGDRGRRRHDPKQDHEQPG